jgi:hypothetical protein
VPFVGLCSLTNEQSETNKILTDDQGDALYEAGCDDMISPNRLLTNFFCDNLARYLAGEPLRNLVDKHLGFPLPDPPSSP